MRLVKPSSEYAASYVEMNEECRLHSPAQWRSEVTPETFGLFLQKLAADEHFEDLEQGYVPQSIYWLVDDENRVVGESRFRHYINDKLLIEGGHIGYHIRPSARQKGYGTEILRLTLRIAKDYGLERVCVTCDTDNVPSAKIIEKNRGVFDAYTVSPRGEHKQVSRYWIDI